MKVLPSIFLGIALGQDYTGFDYDGLERNQISQSEAGHTSMGAGAGSTADGSVPTAYSGAGAGNSIGNGLKCWYCDARTVHACFNSAQYVVCQGQEYFCFYHERRKIGHYFNRREKYIDHDRGTNSDAFLIRNSNEAFNSNDASAGQSTSDRDRPSTQIHVMAGCQQPQACIRQQQQNSAINIGVRFYSDNSGSDTTAFGANFGNGMFPTSKRNAREGLCRLGKEWGYYSGKMWAYDTATGTQVNTGGGATSDITGMGIIDANLDDGHQFYHERESWYNGQRANGFPNRYTHGGKGTESVCHMCCNPASSDGHFCNRDLLDADDVTVAGNGMTFSTSARGTWLDSAASSGNVPSNGIRADLTTLNIKDSPMSQGFDTRAAWLSQARYHGAFRNPETQVYQNFLHVSK